MRCADRCRSSSRPKFADPGRTFTAVPWVPAPAGIRGGEEEMMRLAIAGSIVLALAAPLTPRSSADALAVGSGRIGSRPIDRTDDEAGVREVVRKYVDAREARDAK